MDHHCNDRAAGAAQPLTVLLRHVAKLLTRVHHSHDHAQQRIYAIIHKRGPLKQRRLLEILDVRSSSLSEVLAKLEHNGLITRQRDPEDKRGFVISAAPGQSSPAAEEDLETEHAELLDCLNEAEQQHLAELLEKIIAAAKVSPHLQQHCRHGRKHHKTRERHGHKANHDL